MTNTLEQGNGRAARKSLASQLDRFDAVLDGLADGLNGAVAEAVKDAAGQAVREAIQAVFSELLSNPDLRALLQGRAVPGTVVPGSRLVVRSRAR